MNYKKKKTAFINGKLYNLENWVSLSIGPEEFKDDDGTFKTENRVKIHLPKTESDYTYSTLTVNWAGICEYSLWVHLGVEKNTLESMFLAAECND